MLTESLTTEQIDFYHEQGYLHVPSMFDAEEIEALRTDLDWMIDTWANREAGWSGPWRERYMDEQTNAASKLIAMHDLHFYSQAWFRCITKRAIGQIMHQLLGGPVELHHSTMHVKPQETGHPFPLHQDAAFYRHTDGRYVDALVHLDDTCHENGEIRFVPGSHKQGFLEHITEWQGVGCTPHLHWDDWSLDMTEPVPAKAGDLVLFSIHTIHGSHINRTLQCRRMVRVGYKHTDNIQLGGQSNGRPGMLLFGRRQRLEGQPLFGQGGPRDTPEWTKPAATGV